MVHKFSQLILNCLCDARYQNEVKLISFVDVKKNVITSAPRHVEINCKEQEQKAWPVQVSEKYN